ncbi:MAG: MBL fold metallo-hydrolase, partial [Rhodobacterales bacterium]|nr:MBL fold metallo-hydrolase [Rhodobacterales bacterium]
MALELVTIPCRSDNYSYLVHDADSGQTAVIDVPDAAPILAALKVRNWTLSDILITHHHDDHISGVEMLRVATGAMILGAAADAHRLPPLDLALTEASTFSIGREFARVIDVPGHTLGHIAFHFPQSGYAFTA